MTPQQEAALWMLGFIAYLGLAACVAVAIGLTIREADRREQRRTDAVAIEIEPDTEAFDRALDEALDGEDPGPGLASANAFVTGERARREWYL